MVFGTHGSPLAGGRRDGALQWGGGRPHRVLRDPSVRLELGSCRCPEVGMWHALPGCAPNPTPPHPPRARPPPQPPLAPGARINCSCFPSLTALLLAGTNCESPQERQPRPARDGPPLLPTPGLCYPEFRISCSWRVVGAAGGQSTDPTELERVRSPFPLGTSAAALCPLRAPPPPPPHRSAQGWLGVTLCPTAGLCVQSFWFCSQSDEGSRAKAAGKGTPGPFRLQCRAGATPGGFCSLVHAVKASEEPRGCS